MTGAGRGPDDGPATLGRYLRRRGFGAGERRGDELVVALPAEGPATHRLEASFRLVGPEGEFLLVRVRTDQRLPAAARAEVLSTCNVWNSRMRLPRAWLDGPDPAAAGESEVVIDGCAPVGALRAQAGLDGFADAVIAGARRFWRWVDVHASW